MFKVGFIGDLVRKFTEYSDLLSKFSSYKPDDLSDLTFSKLSYHVLKAAKKLQLKVRSYPIPLGKQRHHKLIQSDIVIADTIESELMLEERGTELVREEEEEICEIMVYFKTNLEENEIELLETLEEVYLEELDRPIDTDDPSSSERNLISSIEDAEIDYGEEEEGEDDEEPPVKLRKYRLPYLVIAFHKKPGPAIEKDGIFSLVDSEIVKKFQRTRHHRGKFGSSDLLIEEEEIEGEDEEDDDNSVNETQGNNVEQMMFQLGRKMVYYNLASEKHGATGEEEEEDFKRLFFKMLPGRISQEPIQSKLRNEQSSMMTVEIFKEDVVLVIRKYLAQLYNLDKFADIISRIGEMCHYYHGKMMNDNPRIEEIIRNLLKNLNRIKKKFFRMFKEEITSTLTSENEETVSAKFKELVQSLNASIFQVRRFESEYFVLEIKDLPKLNWDPNDPFNEKLEQQRLQQEQQLSSKKGKKGKSSHNNNNNNNSISNLISSTNKSARMFKVKRKRRGKVIRFMLRLIHYIEIYGSDSKGLFGKPVDFSNLTRLYFTDYSDIPRMSAVKSSSGGKRGVVFSKDIISNQEEEEEEQGKRQMNLKSIVMPVMCSIFQAFVRKYYSDESSNPFLSRVNQRKIVKIMKKTKTLERQMDETIEKRKLNTKIFWFQKLIFEAFSTFIGFKEESQNNSFGSPSSSGGTRSRESSQSSLFYPSPSLGGPSGSSSFSSTCFQNFLFFKTFFEFLRHLTIHVEKNLLNPSLLSLLFCPSFFGMKSVSEERVFTQNENYLFFTKFFEINIVYAKEIWNYELFVEGKKLYSSTTAIQEQKKTGNEEDDENENDGEKKKMKKKKFDELTEEDESKIREKFRYHHKLRQHCHLEFKAKKDDLKRLKKESKSVIDEITSALENDVNEKLDEENLKFGESDLTKIPVKWKRMQEMNQKNLEKGEDILRQLEDFYSFLNGPYQTKNNKFGRSLGSMNDDDEEEEFEILQSDKNNKKKNIKLKKNESQSKSKVKKMKFDIDHPRRYSRTVSSNLADIVKTDVDGDSTSSSSSQHYPQQQQDLTPKSEFSELTMFLDWMKEENHRFVREEFPLFSRCNGLMQQNINKIWSEEVFMESEECREYLSFSNYIKLKEREIKKLKKRSIRASSINEDSDILKQFEKSEKEHQQKKGKVDVSTLRKKSISLLHEVIRYQEKLKDLEDRILKKYFPEYTIVVKKFLQHLREKGHRSPSKKESSGTDNNNKEENKEKGMRKDDDTKLDLICPLTRRKIENSVILVETGERFEKAEIERHLRNSDIHPITGKLLESKRLIPDYRFLKIMESVKETD